MKNNIYLDYAAATPMDKHVFNAMWPYFAKDFYNPAATYGPARQVKDAVSKAAADTAEAIGAKASEIVFTSGGTEANNLAIHGVMQKYLGSELLISAIEHDSVREPAKDYKNKEIPANKQGIIDLEALEKLISDKTVLVSIMHANNEIGSVQPLPKIAQVIRKVKNDRTKRGISLPLFFHTDACQSANYLDIHAHRLGVDLMTINGGKIYGPKQAGILYVSSQVELVPQIKGGGQQRGLRSGSENPATAVGFARALQIAQKQKDKETSRLKELQSQTIKLLEKNIDEFTINGSMKHRLPNNIHFSLPGQDNERILMSLDEMGIYAAAGSACSAASTEPSHVLKAIGLDEQTARSSLRLSMGRQTTLKDMKKTAKAIRKVISKAP